MEMITLHSKEDKMLWTVRLKQVSKLAQRMETDKEEWGRMKVSPRGTTINS
jgi:hypothetical protein